MSTTTKRPARLSQFIIDYLVDRLHVSCSNVDVIRQFYGRVRKAGYTKTQRKAIYRRAIAAHARNRAFYNAILRGAF